MGAATGLDHVMTREGGCGPEVYGDGGFFVQPMFVRRVPSRDWDRFIKCVKTLVRTSPEYRAFIARCKTVEGMSTCAFMPGVTDQDATIEMHHAILGLHDVAEMVADHMSADSGITSMSVAHEVLRAHFAGMVPVVALSETVHQLVHTGEVAIHVRQVHGDLVALLRTYHRGVTAEHILKVRRALEASRSGELHSPDLLRLPAPEEMYANPRATFDALDAAYRGAAGSPGPHPAAGIKETTDHGSPPWEDDEESEDG
jgi:hypothetical protein